jgi:hypothetical protein
MIAKYLLPAVAVIGGAAGKFNPSIIPVPPGTWHPQDKF